MKEKYELGAIRYCPRVNEEFVEQTREIDGKTWHMEETQFVPSVVVKKIVRVIITKDIDDDASGISYAWMTHPTPVDLLKLKSYIVPQKVTEEHVEKRSFSTFEEALAVARGAARAHQPMYD